MHIQFSSKSSRNSMKVFETSFGGFSDVALAEGVSVSVRVLGCCTFCCIFDLIFSHLADLEM